jgi:lipopolysaccharide export system protein LptC
MNRLTVVSEANNRSNRAFASRGRTDNERQFRLARRHSRRVRLLRIGIPTALGVGIVAIVLASVFNPSRLLSRLPTDFGSLVVSGTKITMTAPRLAGVTRDSRPYVVTARAAAQDFTKPDIIELHDINANLEMRDQGVVTVTARDGLYNAKTEMLTLKQDIVVTSSAGYRALLTEAVVDVRKGQIVSERPVKVISARGTIDANRLEVVNSGELVRFDRGVNMVLKLDAIAPPADRKKEAQ